MYQFGIAFKKVLIASQPFEKVSQLGPFQNKIY